MHGGVFMRNLGNHKSVSCSVSPLNNSNVISSNINKTNTDNIIIPVNKKCLKINVEVKNLENYYLLCIQLSGTNR